MNVIKDVIFEGKILDLITASVDYLQTQIKEKTYLGADARFVTEEEYPSFVRQEMIVNAVTHRAYSISGTDIQIKMFDNRIVVESPGQLPGLVRKENIRYTHFSRNPKIAEFLKAYQFVKEYGEGVDRMCKELEQVGLKAPEYFTKSFLLQAVVYNADSQKVAIEEQNWPVDGSNGLLAEQNWPVEGLNGLVAEQSWPVEGPNHTDVPRKLDAAMLTQVLEDKAVNKPTMDNILKVHQNIETNEIFSLATVEQVLRCSNTTAKRVMVSLRECGVVAAVKVKGAGKGKYRFVNQNEI